MSDEFQNDKVNDTFTITDSDYLEFIQQHIVQLKSNNIPQQFWKPLFLKLKNVVFDAGNTFLMSHVEQENKLGPGDQHGKVKVVVFVDSVEPSDGNNIYLIDHAWTYKATEAKIHLMEVPGLVQRLATLMNLPAQSDNLIEDIFIHMWKYNQTYSFSASSDIENQLPVWYIMDEFGSAIQHSDNPNFRVVPFLHIPEGIAYSLMFPVKVIFKGEDVTRDFVEGTTDELERKARLLPWIPNSLRHISFIQTEPGEDYFVSGRTNETLPNLSALIPKDSNGTTFDPKPLKVFSQYFYINEYLTSPKFSIVGDEESADILWLTSHFKLFKEFSEANPSKFINQFPFECVLTVKDLLAVVCRRKPIIDSPISSCLPLTNESSPSWLQTTYNLQTEISKFISYFQHRQDDSLDNHWICKPWNLARGMDTLITDNLDCIVRLSTSGPKIAQKYIEEPVLFHRVGIGNVKFDVRYVLLLKSVQPLEVYVYKNFFLRFANKPFDLWDFDDYEKHFTVMNYNENRPLYRLLCADFIRQFNNQYPENKWSSIEPKILSMFHEVFKCATLKIPPCGIGHSPQSRALYAADLMLSKRSNEQFEPNLLEINWTPDCQRACEYYPDFFNDIFELLFLDDEKDIFYKLS